MPMPKATESKAAADGGKQTLYDPKSSMCFINAKTPEFKRELAKEFIKFIHTDESLVEFTSIVSALKPYKYEVTESQAEQLTPYAQNLLEIRKNTEMVYPYSSSKLFNNKRSDFLGSSNWSTMIGTTSYNHPTTTMQAGISAKDYFNGLLYSSETTWTTAFRQYW